jgi:hypothetical protein
MLFVRPVFSCAMIPPSDKTFRLLGRILSRMDPSADSHLLSGLVARLDTASRGVGFLFP